jgi:hypothetical protein
MEHRSIWSVFLVSILCQEEFMSSAQKTTDHKKIRRWVEARGGYPARVRLDANRRGEGILRIDFDEPGGNDDVRLERISWEEFFEDFDSNDLAFLHQDKTADGKPSRFNKFIDRADGE